MPSDLWTAPEATPPHLLGYLQAKRAFCHSYYFGTCILHVMEYTCDDGDTTCDVT